MILLLASLALILAAVVFVLAGRWRSRRRGRSDVILLGYDDQDKVSSMRERLLEKIRRGEIE